MLILACSAGFLGLSAASDKAPILAVPFWRSALSGLILLRLALRFGPGLDLRAAQQCRRRPAPVAMHQSLCLQCLPAAALFALAALPFGAPLPPLMLAGTAVTLAGVARATAR